MAISAIRLQDALRHSDTCRDAITLHVGDGYRLILLDILLSRLAYARNCRHRHKQQQQYDYSTPHIDSIFPQKYKKGVISAIEITPFRDIYCTILQLYNFQEQPLVPRTCKAPYCNSRSREYHQSRCCTSHPSPTRSYHRVYSTASAAKS